MKIKTLIILLAIFALLAGAGILIHQSLESRSGSKEMGTLFLPELPVNQAATIAIKTADDQVMLFKQSAYWVVDNYRQYPADFEKIVQLTRALKEAKIGRTFSAGADVQNRLSLRDPEDASAAKEQKALRLEFKDTKGTLLAKILLGKTRSDASEGGRQEGRYAMLASDSKIYLIDKDFAGLAKKPQDWLDKQLTEIDLAEIKGIRCLSPDGEKQYYAFERAEKGKDLALVAGVNPVPRIKGTALQSLTQAVYGLAFEDVSLLADAPKTQFTRRFDFQLFNGLIYRLYPGDACANNRCPLKMEVAFQNPPPKEAKQTDPNKGQPAAFEPAPKAPEELTREAEQLNARLNPWVFTIPGSKHAALAPDLKNLLETTQKEDKKGSKPITLPRKTK